MHCPKDYPGQWVYCKVLVIVKASSVTQLWWVWVPTAVGCVLRIPVDGCAQCLVTVCTIAFLIKSLKLVFSSKT